MFELGWPFWVLFFVLFFGCGRACGWGARRYVESRNDDEDRGRIAGSGERDDRRLKEPDPTPSPQARTRETPLQALQREFVEGRISLERYEQELDALDRIE